LKALESGAVGTWKSWNLISLQKHTTTVAKCGTLLARHDSVEHSVTRITHLLT